MKRTIAFLITLGIFAIVVCADFAPLPLRVGEVREARQNAVILFNQHDKQETLILQTDVSSSRDVDALFFMPLPSEPKVDTAPSNLFLKVQSVVQEKGLHYFEDRMFATLGDGPSSTPKDGLQIVLQARLQEHDVTVVRVESVEHFVSWVADFIIRKKIGTEFDFQKVRSTVVSYLKDDIHFFLFDHVSVKAAGQQMHPLVIDFQSDTVYYPLRVNKLYDGPSDVQLMVLSEDRIPSSRFEQIGFFGTKQVTLDRWEIEAIWKGLADRSRGALHFQCFRLVDPRSWYQELGSGASRGDYLLALPRLREHALKRWDHDVSVSLIWGKNHDPKYWIDQWPGR
jgi:hypothetical protein